MVPPPPAELITGERPQRGNMRAPRVPEECSQETWDLVLRCLKEDPEARPSATELMSALGENNRRHATQAGGSTSRECPERRAGVAVSAPPPPANASPFANGSPVASVVPAATSAPASTASPFTFATTAAGAQGESGAPAAPALPVDHQTGAPEELPPANDASVTHPATPSAGGLAAAHDSPFVFANGVPGVAAAELLSPPETPRPLLKDQSYIALGSAFNHAT